MYIARVFYNMKENEEYKVGYVIGEYEGGEKTLLDENFNYVPRIFENGKSFIAYDFKKDWEKHLEVNIDI